MTKRAKSEMEREKEGKERLEEIRKKKTKNERV